MSSSAYKLMSGTEDQPVSKESGERMMLGVVLGYLVSLAFLTAILIAGYQLINLYNNQQSVSYAERRELSIPATLLLLSLPSAIGGLVTGWIAYVRPLRAAVFMVLLNGFIAPALTYDLEWRRAPGQSVPYLLWEYRDVIAFLGLLAALMLVFAITSASLAGYFRRRCADYPASLA